VVASSTQNFTPYQGVKNRMKLSLPPKKWFFSEFHPLPTPLNANVLFLQVFKESLLAWTKLRVLVLGFPDFMDFSNV
jgi:hypothetical protein